ncbi:hypothetical protein DE146DRAFT_627761 [Phaeosphaeria sp. MPI-PUGE-AT-0046c]|nr:hypothetical protein DE146DRAFT_627761 [Phaeosphaeria sp. MPI-PUGE-AT-0046c]
MDVQLASPSTSMDPTAEIRHTVHNVAARTMSDIAFLIIAYLSSATMNLLGPIMGISSILWFVMRNDEAVKPGFAWIIFGIWSAVYLMYLFLQIKRVAYDKLTSAKGLDTGRPGHSYTSMCIFRSICNSFLFSCSTTRCASHGSVNICFSTEFEICHKSQKFVDFEETQNF